MQTPESIRREHIATQIMAGLMANPELMKTVAYVKHQDKNFDAQAWMAESAVLNADALIAALDGPTPLARELMSLS